jgi:hypothetical protein
MDTPGHAGAVDHVPDEQQLRNQDGQFVTGQRGVSAGRFSHAVKNSATGRSGH